MKKQVGASSYTTSRDTTVNDALNTGALLGSQCNIGHAASLLRCAQVRPFAMQ
jgi:hypothetical protein